jgi:GNAT superfamily N-acetyltransferase
MTTGKRANGQTGKAFELERVTDLDAVWRDVTTLFLEFDAYHQAFQPRQLLPDWEDRLKDRLRLHDDRVILLARYKAEAIGCIVGVIRRNDGLGIDTYGYLSHAFVRERYRRAAVGRALVEAAEAWCRDRGATRIELDVVLKNALGYEFWTHSRYKWVTVTMMKPLERML